MVNNVNLFCKNNTKLSPPPDVNDADSSDRALPNGPIWDLEELKTLIAQDGGLNFKLVTNKAKRDHEKLFENGFVLSDIVSQISSTKDYKNSSWCKTNASRNIKGKVRGSGAWIPCDAYALTCEYEHPTTGHIGEAEYYIKMCKSIDNKAVLFVSVHF